MSGEIKKTGLALQESVYDDEGPGASVAPGVVGYAEDHDHGQRVLEDRSGQVGTVEDDACGDDWIGAARATLAGGADAWKDEVHAMEPLVSGGGAEGKDMVADIGVEGPQD